MATAIVEMDALEKNHPEWYAMFNDVLPDSLASRAELAELWATAPTPFANALIYGKFTLRLEIAAHTGIPFV
ncbi:hypothetical protein [Variovorax sp. RA8]|uniref:hypothetical protein n=1 Tax=Variovorax sp. (strain JCM 16519 / RA8) TaxID=662548 RepID=UPI0013A59715|nr:hypothetical protein [Variovorax sp. RA8]